MTKLTRETAFRVIFHTYIKPPKLTRISKAVKRINNEEKMLKSVNMKDITNIIANDPPSDINASVQISKYCSKNT